jgi:hypothetical protein
MTTNRLRPVMMTDAELIHGLEILARRARLASLEDLRKAADVLADFAMEAATRLRAVHELRAREREARGGSPAAAQSAIMRGSAMLPSCRCGRSMRAHLDPVLVGDCGEYLPLNAAVRDRHDA